MKSIDRLKVRNRSNVLKRDEVNRLVLLAQTGNLNARNRIVEQNVGLVLSIVGRSYNWLSEHDKEDYFQEGVLGLMRAIETYEPDRELEFSTYAFTWIRQKMQRFAMNNKTLIREPIHSQDIKKKYAKLQSLDPRRDHDDIIDQISVEYKLPTSSIQDLLDNDRQICSMNVPSADGSEWEPEAVSTLEDIQDLDMKYMLGYLNFRQRRVIEYRLAGLTLQKIGDKEDISRERVRQIEVSAIKTMRTVADLRSLV